MPTKTKQKTEFGDFQTPDALAQRVCAVLHCLGVSPGSIVEPTCGTSSFLHAPTQLSFSTPVVKELIILLKLNSASAASTSYKEMAITILKAVAQAECERILKRTNGTLIQSGTTKESGYLKIATILHKKRN